MGERPDNPGGPNVWEEITSTDNFPREAVESDETYPSSSSSISLALTIHPEDKCRDQPESKPPPECREQPKSKPERLQQPMNIKPEQHQDEPKKNNVCSSNEGQEHSYESDPNPEVASDREAYLQPLISCGSESRTDNNSLPSLTVSSMNSSEGKSAASREMASMHTISDPDIDLEVPRGVPKAKLSKKVKEIPLEIKRDVLEMYLDPDERVIKCWKHLASRRGVGNQRIEWMSLMSKAPTLDMLKLAEFTDYTIMDLKEDLKAIKRFDCLHELQKHFPDNEQ